MAFVKNTSRRPAAWLRTRLAATVGATVLATAGTVVGTAGTAHADGHGVGWYGVWATGVNIRAGGEFCHLYPSTWECDRIVNQVSAPEAVYVYCQEYGGQSVGGNPYWLWVAPTHGERGWMASYYIDNVTNWIDGVPDC
ncbi:hypothetical protein ACIBBD_31260 [Streptomyces sp. NPDC051315]|uniref:hypothetical protein n=1 Tax=Streptomyces sp. NPDC051315 TaxID=3365650 RepID=UPI0037B16F68